MSSVTAPTYPDSLLFSRASSHDCITATWLCSSADPAVCSNTCVDPVGIEGAGTPSSSFGPTPSCAFTSATSMYTCMSVTEPSSFVQRSVSPLKVTGLCVDATPIQSRACIPVIVHSRVCSLGVRHTRLVATLRSSKAPNSTSCACTTGPGPCASSIPGEEKCASSSSRGPSEANPGKTSAEVYAPASARSFSVTRSGPASLTGCASSDCQFTGGGGGRATVSLEQLASTNPMALRVFA